MELLTIKELGQTSRMDCMTCGVQIATAPAERKALKAGEGIEPRQCRKCKPRARKPEPRKPGHPYRKYTCETCGVVRIRDSKEVKALDPDGPPPPPKKCQQCKRLPTVHGTRREYYRGCRCDECLGAGREIWQEQKASGYKRPTPTAESRGGYTKVCQNPACQEIFYTSDKRKIVCGDACSFEKRKHDRLSSLAPVLYDEAFAETQRQPRTAPTNYIKGTGGVWYVGDCAWCGEGFTRMSWSDPTQCCSAWCSRRLSSENNPHFRKWKHWITDRRRYALYRRDGWVCQICHVKCSDIYDPHDPLSPTLDHILPKSKFAEGDQYMHDDMNLRTAHASCNTDRFLDWDRSGWLTVLVILGELDVKTARELRVERAVHTIGEGTW